MKVRFINIAEIKPVHGSNELISLEVTGAMSRDHLFETMARIWEYIEDDDLVTHFRLEGWELRRVPSEGK